MFRQSFLNEQARKLRMGSLSQWLQKGHSNQQGWSGMPLSTDMQRSACRTAMFCCSGESARLGASLKCLYTNAHSTEERQGESEVCVQLQGCDLLGITKIWWDSSTTGMPQWVDTGSSASMGCEGKEGVSHFMWESRAAGMHGALP